MNKKIKKKLLLILEIFSWIILTGGLFTLVGFTNEEYYSMFCREYTINIDYGDADMLLTKDDIYTIIKQTGHILKGQKIGYINAEKIETALKKQPYVANAEVFMNLDGTVEIDVVQRQPILRIFNQNGESYYLDASGKLLPLNPAFSARVLVASGCIPEPYSKTANYTVDSTRLKDSLQYNSVINHLFRLSLFIMKDKFLKVQVDQIYVDKNGEFELIPRLGNHLILFGDSENTKEKFDRLKIFYKLVLSATGWSRYNVINIKYNNQVVCSKK